MEKTGVCPWCGSSDCCAGFLLTDEDTPVKYCVRCWSCEATGPKNSDRESAVSQWNGMSRKVRTRDIHQYPFSHVDVRAYLLGKGWRVTDQLEDKAEVFCITDDQGHSWDLLVPLRANLGDYARRVREILATLAAFEDRSELTVLDDLRT